MDDDPLVRVEQGEGVAVLTLNRPAARNALNAPLIAAVRAAMAQAEADDQVTVVLLTGADPAFCAGIDLKALSAGESLLDDDEELPFTTPWKPLSKPVIGAINGVAITGGLELALNCDFLVASERAAFADTHARVGVLPGWGLSVLLPQRVGFAMARRMSFTGDFVSATGALRAGLVTEVVPHEDLLPTARRLAAAIAGNFRPAVAALVDSYREIESEVLGEGLTIEAAFARTWRHDGRTAGIAGRVGGVFERGRNQLGRKGTGDT